MYQTKKECCVGVLCGCVAETSIRGSRLYGVAWVEAETSIRGSRLYRVAWVEQSVQGKDMDPGRFLVTCGCVSDTTHGCVGIRTFCIQEWIERAGA